MGCLAAGGDPYLRRSGHSSRPRLKLDDKAVEESRRVKFFAQHPHVQEAAAIALKELEVNHA